MFAKNVIGVYSYKNTDIRNISKFLAEFEVSGRTEIANNSKKTIKVRHTISDTLKFLKKGICRSIIEEFGTHTIKREYPSSI